MGDHLSGPAGRNAVPGQESGALGSSAHTVTFRQLLVNTLAANVTTSFLTWSLAFWVYLETGSVLVAAVVSGISMLIGSLCGAVFGVLVDAHRKKTAMVVSSSVTGVTFAAAGCIHLAIPTAVLGDWAGFWFWAFAGMILVGGVAGQLRSIALSTSVTLLVPAGHRDRANGMVGTVNGVAALTTSVLSGLSVGFLGMGGTVAVAVVFAAVALGHLLVIRFDEPRRPKPADRLRRQLDIRSGWQAMRAVPGLVSLVFFSCFNNLVLGVFMTLMDPYGLNLFSVQAWGVVLGVTSVGIIMGGGIVARFGLGRRPLRILLLVNVAMAMIGLATGVREWQWLLVAGMFGFMVVVPMAESAEQTILQRVVPFDRQGRVFGFAQSVESASRPVAAFVVGPAAQFLLIPYMATTHGRSTFGWLLGEGGTRGIALTFVLASLTMLIVVLLAFFSRSYRRLNALYDSAETPAEALAGSTRRLGGATDNETAIGSAANRTASEARA